MEAKAQQAIKVDEDEKDEIIDSELQELSRLATFTYPEGKNLTFVSYWVKNVFANKEDFSFILLDYFSFCCYLDF